MAGTVRSTFSIPHQCVSLADGQVLLGGKYYFAHLAVRPGTPTIYNVTTTDANWTAVATGLTNVLGWRLSERAGQDFHFAFVASPSTYCTAFGWCADQSEITAIYVKRTGSANITAELLVWTP